jgi:hypothetical protein
MRVRVWATIVVGVIGVVVGVFGAGWLNLAGVDLRDGAVQRGMAWEEGESEFGVILGCAHLIGWLASVVVLMLVSHKDQPDRRIRVLGTTLAWVSIAVVSVLTLVAVAVLPRMYDYMP